MIVKVFGCELAIAHGLFLQLGRGEAFVCIASGKRKWFTQHLKTPGEHVFMMQLGRVEIVASWMKGGR